MVKKIIKSESGNMILLVLIMGAIIAVTMTGTLNLTSSVRRGLATEQKVRTAKTLSDAIVERAIEDLRNVFLQNVGPDPDNCTLDHIFADNATLGYTQTNPRIFGKGYVWLDTSKTQDGSEYLVSETNPELVLEKKGANNWYALHITFTQCEQPAQVVRGRTMSSDETPASGMDIDWSPPCTKSRVVKDTRTFNIGSNMFASNSERRACGLVDPSSSGSDGTNSDYFLKPEGKLLVMHSQTTRNPDCPTGYSTLWNGYSYMGSWIAGNRGAPQDLGKTGSCPDVLHPLPMIECTINNCRYDTPGDRSLWLSIERYNQVASSGIDRNVDERQEAEDNISRCTVCEGAKDVLVQHSLTGTVPDCPDTWDLLWTGYSFGTSHAKSDDFDSGQDLGGTGSCLRIFVPSPINWCDFNECKGSDGRAGWLINSTALPSLQNFNITNADTLNAAKAKVGRCSVCTK